MRTQNLINGQPPQFGNTEHIRLNRKKEQMYLGLKPTAHAVCFEEGFDDTYIFNCVITSCGGGNYFSGSCGGEFIIGEEFRCKHCETPYKVGNDYNLYHKPGN